MTSRSSSDNVFYRFSAIINEILNEITKNSSNAGKLIGAGWLCETYGVQPVQPLKFSSSLGKKKTSKRINGVDHNTFPLSFEPENTLVAHLKFMFKHERVHLEFLSRLFEKVGEKEITEWVLREPSGRFSRRIGWFFEWFTDKTLDVPDVKNAPYVEALEPNRYWTCTSQTRNIPRWRVRDNLPGTGKFCPLVLLTDSVRQALHEVDISRALSGLEEEFGADLLLRSSLWLTIKESRASFEIEGERDLKKTERFAIAMEQYLGQIPDVYGAGMLKIQREILGERSTHYGVRQSPIFIGQTTRFQQIIHYVAPPPSEIPSLLEGLEDCNVRTQTTNSLIRAAVLSFGFVYIHPFADGNGRMSRFLINDVLRKDGLVKPPFLVPVSANILKNRTAYDEVLDVVSAPFRMRYATEWRFGKEIRYSDGVVSNLEFDSYDDANHVWKYIDFTDHVTYLAKIISVTINQEIHQEATYLRQHQATRDQLRTVFSVNDNSLDRIMRSVTENGKISEKLKAEFPLLQEAQIGEQVLTLLLNMNNAVS